MNQQTSSAPTSDVEEQRRVSLENLTLTMTSSADAVDGLTSSAKERKKSMASRNVTFDERDGNDDLTDNGIRFGTIRFKNQISNNRVSSYYRRREFVIIDENSERIDTAEYLAKHWQLGEPKLVISLVGGYRGIKHISSKVKKTFLRELANAVLSTGAWLTTGGLHSGMTKDVGEALRDHAIGRAMAQRRRVVAVGITPVSVLNLKDILSPMHVKNEISITIDPNELGHQQLDPNHTHYLLINDDGSDHTGVKIDAQNRFLKAIAVKRMEGSKSGIPVVCIVVGGGHRRIKSVYETVVENKIPVIILDGSGGAADVLAYASRKLTKKHGNVNTSGQHADQLHLATVLNRIDLAQRLLQTEKTLRVTEVRQSLRLALVNNQVEFVRLFLKKGLNLYEYLTEQELICLYRTVKTDSMFYELLLEELERYPDRNSVQTSVILKDVGNVINGLTTWSFKPLYLQEKITDDTDRFDNPSRELFLWAVLQGRLEMAILFWEESKAPIGGALVAGKLLKEMATRESDLHETRRLTRYEEGGRLFDKLAVEVLTEYYQSDRKLTTLTLVRKLHSWGSAICLDLASTAKNMEFVAHPAVQNMLKEFWMGNLSISNSRWKIWICLVFPPALLCVRLKLKEEEVDPLVVKKLPRGRNTGDVKLRRPQLLRTFSIRRSVLSFFPTLPHRGHGDTDGQTSGPNFTGLPLRELNRRKRIWFAEHEHEKPKATLRRRISTFFFVPLVIFLYNVFSRLVFLGLYSYILLLGFESKYPTVIEYVLIGWFFTLCIELIRQIIWEVGPTFLYRLSIWNSNFWNKVDVCKTVLFITGYVLRCFPHTMSEGRIILAIGLVIFYIRLLHICSANKHLGPKLVMIQGMFADLLVFVSILMVFLTSYGVVREAILYPGRSGISSVLESIFFRPYLQIFGELLETNDDECYTYQRDIGNATHPLVEERCQQDAWFGTILLSIYLFLSNVLLLNLLIAMFNFTFASVQEKTDIHWKWQRFKLITEYHKRPALPPPFIIISHILLIVMGLGKKLRKLCHKCGCACCDKLSCKGDQCDSSIDELAIWESVKGEDYLAQKRQREQDKTNRKLQTNENRLHDISAQVTRIERQVKEEMTTVKEQLKTMQSLLAATVTRLRSQTSTESLMSRGSSRESTILDDFQ